MCIEKFDLNGEQILIARLAQIKTQIVRIMESDEPEIARARKDISDELCKIWGIAFDGQRALQQKLKTE